MNIKLTNESMSSDLITINWSDLIKTAFEKMHRHRVRHLPVMNDSGEVIGMLSDRDVQRAMISQIKHEKWAPLSSETIEFDPGARVRDYMGWPVIAIESSVELRLAAERMLREKISSILVQERGRMVGIITTDDLVKVLIGLLKEPKAPPRLTLQDLLSDSDCPIDGAFL